MVDSNDLHNGEPPKSDKEKILEILNGTKDVLSFILEHKNKVLPIYLNDPYEEAWKDFDTNFKSVYKEINSNYNLLEKKLFQIGLTGTNLSLKYAGFKNTFTEFHKFMNSDITRMIEFLGEGVNIKFLSVIKKGLKWINIFLGSLSSVIPGAEFLKEFKECAEQGIEESIENYNGDLDPTLA